MLTLQAWGSLLIAAAALAVPLTASGDGRGGRSTLYTAPMLSGPGIVDCPIVNVGRQPRTVTTTYFDNAGHVVGSSGEQLIAPGVVGGASFGAQDGYCQWVVDGPASEVRATGRVNHFSAGTDVYPAEPTNRHPD